MLHTIIKEAQAHMEKAIGFLKKDLASIRTGRANAALLDPVKVDYYGTLSPISQIAAVTVPESRTILIKPWEKNLLKLIEKAILDANLGLTPTNDGDVIRIGMPPLTEERRKEFVKQAKSRGEEARVSIRNVRRDANEALKKALKEASISEDEEKRGLKQVQDLTDQFVKGVDELLLTKESEILTI